jgi:carbonic anhydrase/acetyltransferase-like protein (isoleucine patch superfamily)
MNMNQQLTNKTSPASQYPIVFAADGDNISAYLNNNGSQTTTLIFKDNYNKIGTRPSIASFGGRYLTAACDRTGTQKTYFTQSATALGGGTSNGSGNVTVPALKYFIGGTDENHYAKGTMHSFRIYNRLLTDEEMAQNNEVDEVRFRGDGVIVCTQTDGLDGAEPCGFYKVDGSHTFSAPAEQIVGETTWRCVGYTIDIYDDVNDVWSSDGVNHQNELQYSYDSANGGRVRLKWQWTKKRAGYAWTGAGGDGKFSTLANWADLVEGTVATELPASGQTLSFSAGVGGTLVNDLEGLGGAEIIFPVTAGQYTITSNGFVNVANVVNETSLVQTFSNTVAFASTYNVALAAAVDFAGGATATKPGDVSGAVGTRLVGDITFTEDWAMNASYIIPFGTRVTGKNVTGSGAALTIDQGGYAHFATIQPGKNDTVWRINLIVNGMLEVDGNVAYWNSGGGGSVQAISGNGVIKAKGFYKQGGKQHLTNIQNIKIGAGSATSNPIFGATYGSNMLHFYRDITIQAMGDIEFQSVLGSGSMAKENGGLCLEKGYTMTINTEDDDGNPHTVIWGCSFCVKTRNSSGTWGYSTGNVRLSKQGKGTLIMRNRCSITGSSGYVKDYHGYTDVRGGTLRVEEKGQLSASALTIYGGGRFELGGGVVLPNNTTLRDGNNSIALEDGAQLKLTTCSGDNASISLGASSVLTGNVSLGTNSTVTGGAQSKITGNVVLGDGSTLTGGLKAEVSGDVTLGNDAVLTGGQDAVVGGSVTVGTNSVVTLDTDAAINLSLTMGTGTTLNMSLDTAKAEGEDVVLPIGGIIKLTSGTATVKLTGDFSDYESEVISKALGALDVNTDVKNLKLDTAGVKFPEGLHYYPKLKNENGMLVFYAFRPRFHIILK